MKKGWQAEGKGTLTDLCTYLKKELEGNRIQKVIKVGVNSFTLVMKSGKRVQVNADSLHVGNGNSLPVLNFYSNNTN